MTALSILAPLSVSRNASANITGTLSSVNPACVDSQSVLLKKGRMVVDPQLTSVIGAYDFTYIVSNRRAVKVTYASTASCRSTSSVKTTIKVS